jgi:SAM-dependent methyltransferase
MDRVVSFVGLDHDFFTAAKADELVSLAERHLGDLQPVNALDVGCGIGLTERFLHGRLERVTGVDVAPGVLEVARETNPWARYELYDGTRLPFDDESFGLAFAICVVQVVPKGRRAALITELTRVVRRDGLVVVFEHNPLNPLTQLVARRCTFGNNVEMLRIGTLRRLFEHSGLAVRDAGFMLVFPKRSSRLLALERHLCRVPLGAQYYVAGSPA